MFIRVYVLSHVWWLIHACHCLLQNEIETIFVKDFTGVLGNSQLLRQHFFIVPMKGPEIPHTIHPSIGGMHITPGHIRRRKFLDKGRIPS